MRFLSLLIMGAWLSAVPFATHTDAALTHFAKVESVGGYTLYNQSVDFWASVTGGRIQGGYALVTRKYHRDGTTLRMTGSLDAQTTRDLWQGILRARPWSASEVRASFVNIDLPDTRVTYRSFWTQTILAGFVVPPQNLPLVSAEMESFVDLAWDVARKVAEGPLFVYTAAGGRLGYSRTLTIRQDGGLIDDVKYLSGARPGYTQDTRLSPDQVNELKKLVGAADWWNLGDFPGRPSTVDGIDETGTYYLWGRKKTVFGGSPNRRTTAFQAVLDQVVSFAPAQ